MEYFDMSKLTMRQGDRRILRESRNDEKGKPGKRNAQGPVVRRHELLETEERIVRELPLEVYLNGRRVITIACAGMHVEELAVGFLVSEGVLRNRTDLSSLEVSEDGREVRVRTAEAEGRPEPSVTPERTVASSGAGGMGLAPRAESVGAVRGRVRSLLYARPDPGPVMRFLGPCVASTTRPAGTNAAALVRGGDILAVRPAGHRRTTRSRDMLGDMPCSQDWTVGGR
jgi:formate dehydrogenase assembly factor FdhD